MGSDCTQYILPKELHPAHAADDSNEDTLV
jgi:hypothetical protein